jgi:probable HAF family extracellular repeat protein
VGKHDGRSKEVIIMRINQLNRRTCTALIAVSLTASFSHSALAQGVVWLGTLPGGTSSYARAISADGTTIVGDSDSAEGSRAFRWTAAGGMEDLGVLASGQVSVAYDVNPDGSVVVGQSGSRAFRWTAAEGMVDIGSLGTFAVAHGVSSNGSVVVGSVGPYPARAHPAIWSDSGIEDLGLLPGGTLARALDVSADGSVVVGYGDSDVSHRYRGFRWTRELGLEDIGALPRGFGAIAKAVTPDGSVIVGEAVIFGGAPRAFRWTAEQGIQNLGVLPNSWGSTAEGVSADGLRIVGTCVTRAVVWQPSSGMVDLNQVLQERGIERNGGTLKWGVGVSGDGRTFTGYGSHGGRSFEAWVVSIPRCAADFNDDFLINSQDFFEFLTAFFAAEPGADFDGSGSIDSADFFAFTDAFLAGACE